MPSIEDFEFWEEFIEMYKENPCLWNIDCEDYTNESKRNIAYGLLVEKLWELDDGADEKSVQNNIEQLKTSLREEMAKVQKAKDEGQIYEPTWCHYKSLNFLVPFESAIATKSTNIEIQDSIKQISPRRNETPSTIEISSSTEPIQETSKTEDSDADSIAMKESSPSTPPVKKRRLTKAEESEDDCSTFAKHLRVRMRSFDPLQKCIAQKLISDVMFMAETKQLNLASSILNPPGKQ